MNIESNDVFTQSNKMIKYSFDDMGKKELQLLAILLASFKADNFDATTLEEVKYKVTPVTLSEVCACLDLDYHSGGNTEYLKEIIKGLTKKSFITWQDEVQDRTHITMLFTDINMPNHWGNTDVFSEEKDYNIYFTWNDSFIPHLVQNKDFTKLFKSSILKLKSQTAIKLYQFLKMYANKDKPTTIAVSTLRQKLRLTSKSYDRFERFYTRGIAKPLEEINKHTEIEVEAIKNHSKRDKRIVESITFKIKNSDKKYTWDDGMQRFPDVRLTRAEYYEIKQWNSYPDWKLCCADLQKKLDENVDIRNHYKWIIGHHRELEKKHQQTLAAPQDNSQSDDDYYRSLFQPNPYA
jgi:plasmid replication initiation protein